MNSYVRGRGMLFLEEVEEVLEDKVRGGGGDGDVVYFVSLLFGFRFEVVEVFEGF